MFSAAVLRLVVGGGRWCVVMSHIAITSVVSRGCCPAPLLLLVFVGGCSGSAHCCCFLSAPPTPHSVLLPCCLTTLLPAGSCVQGSLAQCQTSLGGRVQGASGISRQASGFGLPPAGWTALGSLLSSACNQPVMPCFCLSLFERRCLLLWVHRRAKPLIPRCFRAAGRLLLPNHRPVY